VGVATLTSVPLPTGAVAFDHRGALTPAAVNVLYIGNVAFRIGLSGRGPASIGIGTDMDKCERQLAADQLTGTKR